MSIAGEAEGSTAGGVWVTSVSSAIYLLTLSVAFLFAALLVHVQSPSGFKIAPELTRGLGLLPASHLEGSWVPPSVELSALQGQALPAVASGLMPQFFASAFG